MNANASGWFGAQLGGTVWMLLSGLLALRFDVTAGSLVLGLFLAVNLVGTWLWSRRETLPFRQSIQWLLVALGLTALAAVFVLDRAGVWEQIQVGGRVGAWPTYLLILVLIGGLMAFFRLRA